VAGSCKYSDEPAGSGTTELISSTHINNCYPFICFIKRVTFSAKMDPFSKSHCAINTCNIVSE
jgi:hypothetical protein